MWRGKDCENVHESEPVRQGDLLRRFMNGRADSLWVVVTADCDIAQSKVADSGLACVQLRPLRDYLLGEHLDRVLSRQLESRLREVREWIRSQWAKSSQPHTQLSDRAILDWISVASADEIFSELDVKDDSGVRSIASALSALRLALSCRCGEAETPKKFQVLASLQKKQPQDWRQFVQSQLARLQSNQLPDDLFFVTRIADEPHLGYVAKLRTFSFVRWASVARTVPEARDRSDAYVRIARLAPTFKHGIAQQVGFLFARIGYPVAYEAERDEIFDLVMDEICDEFGDTND